MLQPLCRRSGHAEGNWMWMGGPNEPQAARHEHPRQARQPTEGRVFSTVGSEWGAAWRQGTGGDAITARVANVPPVLSLRKSGCARVPRNGLNRRRFRVETP